MKHKFTQVNEDDRMIKITSEKLAFIYECAMRSEYLDGTFSDMECTLWEMYRRAYDQGYGAGVKAQLDLFNQMIGM